MCPGKETRSFSYQNRTWFGLKDLKVEFKEVEN